MKLYLDCEFNGFRGELISIALVSACGTCFYRIVSDTIERPTQWVSEHVIPLLESYCGMCARGTRSEIRSDLEVFLAQFDSIHVVADWPEDIMHFCKLLLTDVPGHRINTPPLTMEIVRVDCSSELPHNALADAIGIRDALTKSNS